MRLFYTAWSTAQVRSLASTTARTRRIPQTASGESPDLQAIAQAFPLLVIDLKVGKFSYADAGQMHLYLNYAREHWMKPGENPLVGLIMRAEKGAAEARYAMEGLPNKVLAAEYQTALPDEALLARELDKTRRELEARQHRRIAPD